jgi:hypothetical protein
MKIAVFCDGEPRSLVEIDRVSEVLTASIIRAMIALRDHKAQHPRRQSSSKLCLTEFTCSAISSAPKRC